MTTTPLLRVLCWALLMVVASGGAWAQAVVAIGGALKDDNAAVWSRVVQLAGGPGARIAVLATASAEPARTLAQIGANLQRHGAVAVPLADAAAADAPALVAGAGGIFFSGGEQARLLDALQPAGQATPLLQAVRALLARGGVVAGTSAGAAVLSEVAFRDAPDVFGALLAPLVDGRETDRGFALLDGDIAVDQHFVKRGRIGRLLPLLLQRGVRFGLGVEEDSAAVVRGASVEAIGARGVMVVDTGGARRDPAAGAFNVRGVRLSWLAAGDNAELRRGVLRPAAGKAPALPAEQGPASEALVTDILGDNALVLAMGVAARGRAGAVQGLAMRTMGPGSSALGFEWRLARTPETRVWAGRGSVDDTFENVLLDVLPIRLAEPLYTPWPRPAR